MSIKQIMANRKIAEQKRKKELLYDGIWWHITEGYYRTSMNHKIVRLHRYIWEKHNGLIPKGMFVHHKDGNKLNNNIENLQLITNSRHSILHQTGRKYSLEARETMRQKAIGYKRHLGFWHTQETKEKCRAAALEQWKMARLKKLLSAC